MRAGWMAPTHAESRGAGSPCGHHAQAYSHACTSLHRTTVLARTNSRGPANFIQKHTHALCPNGVASQDLVGDIVSALWLRTNRTWFNFHPSCFLFNYAKSSDLHFRAKTDKASGESSPTVVGWVISVDFPEFEKNQDHCTNQIFSLQENNDGSLWSYCNPTMTSFSPTSACSVGEHNLRTHTSRSRHMEQRCSVPLTKKHVENRSPLRRIVAAHSVTKKRKKKLGSTAASASLAKAWCLVKVHARDRLGEINQCSLITATDRAVLHFATALGDGMWGYEEAPHTREISLLNEAIEQRNNGRGESMQSTARKWILWYALGYGFHRRPEANGLDRSYSSKENVKIGVIFFFVQ